jgi:transcriptional regulator with XRE-family HTH domain
VLIVPTKNLKLEFGKALRLRRLDAGETLATVSKAINCSVVYLSQVERGEKGPLDAERVRLFCELLGCEDDLNMLQKMAREARGFIAIPTASRPAHETDVVETLLARLQSDDGLSKETAEQLLKLLRERQ